jgi:hypothetical protein
MLLIHNIKDRHEPLGNMRRNAFQPDHLFESESACHALEFSEQLRQLLFRDFEHSLRRIPQEDARLIVNCVACLRDAPLSGRDVVRNTPLQERLARKLLLALAPVRPGKGGLEGQGSSRIDVWHLSGESAAKGTVAAFVGQVGFVVWQQGSCVIVFPVEKEAVTRTEVSREQSLRRAQHYSPGNGTCICWVINT